MISLTNKHILIGITGGIAAYKIPLLIRELQRAGAQVKVILTEAASAFITPLTLRSLCGRDNVYLNNVVAMEHIDLARWADVILIAPASANTLANLAQGLANNLLTTTVLASTAKIAVAPAMNKQMWENQATQANLVKLHQRDILLWGPGKGEQACGENGWGRLLEPQELLVYLSHLWESKAFSGKKVVITAGPTQEYLDPIRYLTNCSSGKMGYALAAAALEAGAQVDLVTGPVNLAPLDGVNTYGVTSAVAMRDQVLALMPCDLFIGAAAVADYRPSFSFEQKMKSTLDEITLTLVKNPDIIATVARLPQRPFVVGFAAETEAGISHAQEKRERKQLDMILLNDVSKPEEVFNHACNAITLITAKEQLYFSRQRKTELARKIIEKIGQLI